jgi:peroxiredoxin Q/BCP
MGLGVSVVGMSVDSPKVLEGFAKKHGLAFPLASDEDRAVCRAYGVLKENVSLSANRATVVLDGEGTIVLAYPKVKAEGHALQVLEDVTKARQEGRL